MNNVLYTPEEVQKLMDSAYHEGWKHALENTAVWLNGDQLCYVHKIPLARAQAEAPCSILYNPPILDIDNVGGS